MDRFAALADPTRRSIVEMLGERALSAGEIGSCFSASAPAISQHLKVLREAGLIVGTRRGRWIDYQLTDDAMGRLHAALPVPDSRACGCAVDPEPALAGARR